MSMPGAGHPGHLIVLGLPGTAVGEKTQLVFFSSQTALWLLVNIVGTVQLEMFYGVTST